MKLETIIFLILVVHLIAINSQRISIIGSQFIPEDSNYKVLLLTNNLDEESFVNISLICDGQEKIQHFSGLRDSSFKEVKFKVSTKPANNYELKAISSENDKCMQQSIKLIKTHENPKIFVQLDKPIYKSKDDIKFRIFVLNKLLIPVTSHGQLDVAIYDSNNNLVQNFDNIKTKAGVFEGLVKIAFAPNFGRWKIVTNSMGREIVKYFNVEKSVDEDLEVQLEIPSIVSFKDKRIYINVVVSDKLNKFFIGSASISASAKFKGSNKIEINHHVMNVDLFGNKKVIPIDFSDDLGIRFPTADMLLKFDVTVTDAATKRSLKVSKEIEMKYKIRNVIQVSRRKYFKPGFKLPTKVRVKLLDGRIDNSFNQLSITNEYHNRNKKTKNIEKLIKPFKLSLRNGEVSNILQIKPETEAVVVKLEFAGTELIETIKPLETYGANEYMQIAFANRSTKVGDTVMLSATTTGEFETLHVLIIGQDGIIHSQEFSDAIGIDIFKFPIKLTNEMKPEARLLAFYVKPESGVIIYDELQINLGFSIDNSIDIYADEISSPNKQATIRFKTEKGSKVYLSAADINPLLLSRDNEISRNDIYNEMVYYINLKYPNSSDYHFEKLNAFILNPLISESSCEDESAIALSYDSNVNDEFSHDNNDIKYFPDVWFDESYVTINDEEQSISHKVPEALTTFRFFGISVHPQKGFTVAKVQPKTRVKREILIQLKAPPSVYNEEILWLDVAVFNTLLESLNADVTVTITNGVLVDYHRRIEYNIKCLDFQQASIRSFNFSTNIEAEKLSRIETLLIQPDGNGDITVAVDAFAGSYNDEVTKVIKVRNIPTSSNINEESISEAVKVESNSNLSIQDILSSSVKTLESFFSNSLTSDEERLLRFSSAITSHKYLQLNSKGSTNKLVTGYQEALSILDKIFQSKDQNSIILTAIAVETLIEARQFINVDQTLITKAFDFLKTYQQDDGSFIYDSNIDYREEMGENRKDIQTAHIVSIFLKNEDKKDFMDVITKALNYLKQSNIADDDYQKVITAYALALNKDLKSAENLLKVMKNMHLALQKHKLNAVNIEVVSYKILTKILLDEDPQEDTNWMLKQIRSFNEYYSPYNAELTLRALFEFAKYKHIQPDESSKNVKIFELEKHHLKPANTSENFIIKANRVEISREELRIEISLEAKDQDIKNLIGFEMELPRGFRYIKQDSSENLLNFNIDNNGNLVQFQLNKLKVGKIVKISINAQKVFEFSTHQYSMIKVFDYYRSNIKDTFYYVFDKNEESCERIRVEREIEKAKNVLDNANSAQNILSEAQTINTDAQQYINEAQIIADNAKQNLDLSNTKLFEAQEKLSNALNITQNSIEILTNSENAGKPAKSEISIVQIHSIDSPQRLKRNVILLESEAIRTQNVAEDARNQANEANEQALKAEKALNVSISSFDKATKDVESAKRDVKHALSEIKATISEAKVLYENVESAKNEVSALKNNLLNETEKKFYQLDNHIKSVKIDVENNVQNISQTQKIVKAALSTANSILVRARKALKGSDVQADIDNEGVNVENILETVRNILSGTKATKKIATEAFESINFIKKRTNEVKEKCESLYENSDSIMQKANEVYEKSNEKVNLYIKKLESEVKKSEIANNAQISMNKAQSEFENASKKYEDDNFAAISAKDEADKARAEEVKRAESNANISSNQVAIIEGVVSKISNLSTEVADIEAKAKNIRNKANDHFKFLENRHHLLKKSEILKSYRENEEEKKLLTSTRIHLVQNLTKEAQEVLKKAHLFTSEISQSVNNAIKSSDSVKTTFESNKIANLLGELKLLTSKVSAIESSLIEIVASCNEAKMLAEITHEVSQEVMKIFNDFSEANKNFNNANQNKKKLLSSVNSLNDNMENSKLQHLTSNLENLYREFHERLLNSEKSNMQQVLKNAFNTALNVANSKDYVDSLRKKDEFPTFRNITHNSNIELQKMITHIKLADQILHQIIEVRNYADSVAKAEHDINNTQILAVQNILPNLIQIDSNLKAQDINEKSLMNSFTSLFKNLMSTIKAAENDKSLAILASEEEKKFNESVQRVFNAAENIVKEKILEDATQSAIQVEASLNDTVKHKNEILKIKEISLLSLEAAKAVAKASNALVKSFNGALQAIQEEKNTTESQALADEIFKSLQNKTDAKLIIDNITSLMITLETASAQIQQAAVNVLNNLIDAENQRKSIEGLFFENQDIGNIKTYVNLANEAAEKAEQESKLAEKSFEETKAVAFQIHENLKLIENIAENEKNENELNKNRIESRNEDKHEEQNKSEKNADNLEEKGEELKQQMINEDAKIESATTSSSQAVDEHEINENDLSKTVGETDEQKTDNDDTKGNHDEVTQQSITENGEKSAPIQEAESVSKIDEGMS